MNGMCEHPNAKVAKKVGEAKLFSPFDVSKCRFLGENAYRMQFS
jgi:hypothetical protein